MEPGDVSIEGAELLEGAGAVITLVLVVVLDVMNTPDVRPKISSLRELHGAKAAGVGLLSCVFEAVTLQALFLCEGLATVLTLVRSDSRVNSFVSRHLGRLEELFAAIFAA